MWFKYFKPKWYYIDPNQDYVDSIDWKPEDHDGTTLERAAINLPAVLEDGTVYLIRRSDRKFVVREGEDYPRAWCYSNDSGSVLNDGLRVAIVGMPKRDDPYFAYMPEDAQEAWGDDAYDYGILCQSTKHMTKHNITLNAKEIVLYNLLIKRFYRQYSNSSDIGSKGTYSFMRMSCDSIEINKVYSCIVNSDFLQEDERNGTIEASGDRYRWYTPHLFHITYTNTCYIHDSTFLASPDSSDAGYHIYLYTKLGNCTIDTVTIHNMHITTNYYTTIHNGFFHFTGPTTYKTQSVVLLKNLKVLLYKNTTSSSHNSLRPIVSGSACIWKTSNITVEQAETQWGSYLALPSDYLFSFSTFTPGSVIEDITFNDQTCKGLQFLKYEIGARTSEYDSFFTAKSQWHTIRNISFIGTQESDGVDTVAWGKNSTVLTVDNLQERLNDRVYTGLQPSCDLVILQNINIKSYYNTSTALSAVGAMLDLNNVTLECKVKTRKCTGKIGTIKTYSPSGAFVDSEGGNLIYINSIICNRNNPDSPYTGQQAITPSWRSQILVGSTNTKFIQDNNFSNSDINNENDHMYLCTSDTLEGNFVARNKPAKAETWSVYRTGGHSCTLRFVCELSNIANYPLRVGDLPFAGISRHLQKGTNKCTFYLTTFGYNDPSQVQDNMRFRAKLPSGTYIGQDGEWSEDNGTVWNNIELNTSYKYTFYIEMEEEGDVEFSYQFWWYMLGGYTYLDPFPVIELVE